MGTSENTRLDFWVEAWKKLIGPILILVVGSVDFLYQAFWGGNETFGLVGVGLALAGAGFSADAISKIGGAR